MAVLNHYSRKSFHTNDTQANVREKKVAYGQLYIPMQTRENINKYVTLLHMYYNMINETLEHMLL